MAAPTPPSVVTLPAGWRRARNDELTPAAVEFAKRCLTHPGDMGNLQLGSFADGQPLAAFTEWHYHEPGGVLKPWGWHVGITILVPEEGTVPNELETNGGSVIPPLRNADKAGEAFWTKVLAISAKHGWDPRALAAIMSVETGYTFSPTAGVSSWKPSRTATGLIQFTEETARELGVLPTSTPPSDKAAELGAGKEWATWTLARMTALDQLDLVEAYFARAEKGGAHFNRSPLDYYLVTWGTYTGRGLNDVLAKSGSRAYEGNKALDKDGKGSITVGDLNAFVTRGYPAGWNFPKVSPAPDSTPDSEAEAGSLWRVWQSWGFGLSHVLLPVLRVPDRGPSVALLQAVLSKLNILLVVDGAFGMLTKAGVTLFQRQHQLEPDGVVGPLTWTTLVLQLGANGE